MDRGGQISISPKYPFCVRDFIFILISCGRRFFPLPILPFGEKILLLRWTSIDHVGPSDLLIGWLIFLCPYRKRPLQLRMQVMYGFSLGELLWFPLPPGDRATANTLRKKFWCYFGEPNLWSAYLSTKSENRRDGISGW